MLSVCGNPPYALHLLNRSLMTRSWKLTMMQNLRKKYREQLYNHLYSRTITMRIIMCRKQLYAIINKTAF